MRAVVHDRYGPPDVLCIEEIERPVPKDDEVLVNVRATTVNRSDCGLRGSEYWFARVLTGLRRPKRRVAGMELAGVVEAVGTAVSEFGVGDEVFGIRGGANAEYICVRELGLLAHKPTNMTFDEAAAVSDGACTAVSCLRQVGLREGHELLVYGATGSIGTAAVQLAKHHFGAHVTAVGNTKNLELLRSLGADDVIDYTTDDFTKNGRVYDVIFDAVGKHGFLRCRKSLRPGGIYISADGLVNVLWFLLTARTARKRARLGMVRYRREDVLMLKDLIEEGKFRAVIDRSYPLDDVVEATRYVETRQKTGNVVLTVA